MKQNKKYLPTAAFIFLTLAVFALTRNPITKNYSLQMALISLVVFLFYAYLARKKGKVVLETKTSFFLLELLQ